MDLSDLSALLGAEASGATHQDIWIVSPSSAHESISTCALIGLARQLADGLGCYVHLVTSERGSPTEAHETIALGVDRVHFSLDRVGYLVKQQPEFILLPDADAEEAAKLAQRFGAGLITNTPTVAIDGDTRALRGAHPVYGGDYLLDLEVNTPVKIATVDTRGWPEPAPDASRSGALIYDDSPPPPEQFEWPGAAAHTPPNWRPLQKARTIVSVGRGLGGEVGLSLALELAKALDAEFAGDRSARDSGWIDAAHEVGVTGQEVAPMLYIALGILGDTIHNAAIAGAKRVIAVHPNPDAPIFQVADVAIVGDPAAILPLLLAQL